MFRSDLMEQTKTSELKNVDSTIFYKMSATEFNFIRLRAGISFAEIGRNAQMFGKRSQPYDRSTIYRWTWDRTMTMKAVELLYLSLRPEQFRELRREWTEKEREREEMMAQIKKQKEGG